MMKRIIFLGMVFYWVFSLLGSDAHAIFKLFDNRLELTVRADEYFIFRTEKHEEQEVRYSQALTVWRHRFQTEALLKLYEEEDTIINFYTWINFYYEAAPSFNDKISHAMDSAQRRNMYQLPFYHRDDVLQECYLDYDKGPLTLRIGKQTVVWGEMGLERTTDVINPIDIRYSTPGIDEFDELKIAIYMLRTRYITSWPWNTIFEFIYNPGDYERTRTGIQGSDRGAPAIPNEELGGMGWIAAQDTLKNRISRFAIKNWAVGLRVTNEIRPKIGKDYYAFLINMQYYTGLDSPIVPGDQLKERSAFVGKFMSGRSNGNIRELPNGTFFEPRRYEMIGLGIQTEEPRLTKSIVVLESAYFWGLDFNTTEDPHGGSFATLKPREIGFFTYGLTLKRPTDVSFLKSYIDHTARGVADITFSLYQGWFLTNRISEIKKPGDFSYDNKSETTVTASFMTDFFSKRITFVSNFLYNARDWGYYTLSLTYSPSNAWKFTIGEMEFFANNETDSGTASSRNSDRVFVKIRYEF